MCNGMFTRFWLYMLLVLGCGSLESYSLVFVHIGPQLPIYLKHALQQARLFNPQADIYLIADKRACRVSRYDFTTANIKQVFIEELPKTKTHERFIQYSVHDRVYRGGFWFCASQRFLYINDLMQHLNLSDVFHLENDNMLYVDLGSLLPTFKKYYPGIAAIFDNDERCVPGFLYISEKGVMKHLAEFFVRSAHTNENDMVVINAFRKMTGAEIIDNLPTVTKSYTDRYQLVSVLGHVATVPEKYSQHVDELGIFDGAAIGQFFDGADPRNGPTGPGFINVESLFNSSYVAYEWHVDVQGRKVPYAVLGADSVRINTLHIHSKRLEKFLSVAA